MTSWNLPSYLVLWGPGERRRRDLHDFKEAPRATTSPLLLLSSLLPLPVLLRQMVDGIKKGKGEGSCFAFIRSWKGTKFEYLLVSTFGLGLRKYVHSIFMGVSNFRGWSKMMLSVFCKITFCSAFREHVQYFAFEKLWGESHFLEAAAEKFPREGRGKICPAHVRAIAKRRMSQERQKKSKNLLFCPFCSSCSGGIWSV